MKILFVAVEMTPLAKVGGLADVIGSLPKALRDLGHDVRVVLPFYGMIENDPRLTLHKALEAFPVQMNPHWSKDATFWETEVDGVPVGLIGTDEWFPLSKDSESLYQPGGDMHLFFSAAIPEAMDRIDWIPDVLHCHDWHTGLLPALIREKTMGAWDKVGIVFTIHNLAYQGEFGPEVLDALELSRELYTFDKLETFGHVNFLKSGCVYSEIVNTVSENYAQEIQTPEFGCHLEGLMKHLWGQGRLSGIVNGIDLDRWNPAEDRRIPVRFSAADLTGKVTCRTELLEEVGLPEIPNTPVLGIVSRLSSQKGMDLITEIGARMLTKTQLIVLGVGDPAIASDFKALQAAFPDRVRLIEKFDADLAQRIYAGCDGFLMPSTFEPCGLGQMFAMRYGTVPVVRSTGGLADTVKEGVTGFTFANRDASELLAAVERLVATYQKPKTWSKLVLAGMMSDFSWEKSAISYVKLYVEAARQREEALGRPEPVLAEGH